MEFARTRMPSDPVDVCVMRRTIPNLRPGLIWVNGRHVGIRVFELRSCLRIDRGELCRLRSVDRRSDRGHLNNGGPDRQNRAVLGRICGGMRCSARRWSPTLFRSRSTRE